MSKAKLLTEENLREMVAQMVEQHGSQYLVSTLLGVTQSYINDFLHKKRTVGKKIPQALGYERVVTYRKREDV